MKSFKRCCIFIWQFFTSNEPPKSISRRKRPHDEDDEYDSSYYDERCNLLCLKDEGTNSEHLKNNKLSFPKKLYDHPHQLQATTPVIMDNEDGHLIYNNGDILANKYRIIQTIGKGTFGTVVSAKSLKNQDQIAAVKIIKNDEKYRDIAYSEINVLKELNKKDPENKNLCVHMIDCFELDGHVCIGFELLGLSVFDFLEQNNFQSYSIDQIRHISYQLCYAVRFLHRNKLTHTDLKPENIIFVNSEYDTKLDKDKRVNKVIKNTEIRLIDFGSATFDEEHHSSVVSTKHYRAPEIILKLGWAQPCDVWSIGCIIFELYTGIPLFRAIHDHHHLAMMECILGPIPREMTNKFKIILENFIAAKRVVKNSHKPLKEYMKSEEEDHQLLFDLIFQMLKYLPSERITMENALYHQFFNKLPDHQKLQDKE